MHVAAREVGVGLAWLRDAEAEGLRWLARHLTRTPEERGIRIHFDDWLPEKASLARDSGAL